MAHIMEIKKLRKKASKYQLAILMASILIYTLKRFSLKFLICTILIEGLIIILTTQIYKKYI